MKTKITINSIFGNVLFEYEKENNTIKDTVLEAVKTGAYLRGADLRDAKLRDADLRGADLRGADLTGAYLRGADLTGAYLIDAYLRGADLTGAYLRGAYLTGAYLRGADLTGAYLTGAYLRGADLTGAYLRGADLRDANDNKIKIQKATVFTGLYKYLVMPFIADDGEKWVRMGCFVRKLSEWESNFWNNDNEFPNNGSEQSKLRLFAFETAKRWFEVVESEKGGEG